MSGALVKILGWSALILLAMILLDRFALWAESRGWIYYRRTKASPGTAGSAFLEMQALLEPGAKEVIEARAEQLPEEDGGADPPERN